MIPGHHHPLFLTRSSFRTSLFATGIEVGKVNSGSVPLNGRRDVLDEITVAELGAVVVELEVGFAFDDALSQLD